MLLNLDQFNSKANEANVQHHMIVLRDDEISYYRSILATAETMPWNKPPINISLRA